MSDWWKLKEIYVSWLKLAHHDLMSLHALRGRGDRPGNQSAVVVKDPVINYLTSGKSSESVWL